MGLASSQARLLQLVARKSDLEFRGQMINHRRLLIARDTEEVSKNYSDALNNRTLSFKNSNGDVYTTALGQFDGYGFLDTNGLHVYNTGGTTEITSFTTESLEAGLRNGTLIIKNDDDKEVGWRTDTTHFTDEYDKSDDAAAEAEYQYKSSMLQVEDKRLEMELKGVDTQHSAVQTEMDAVKKVIDKNIESSFKTFG
ncbi:MAG: hypothetical protein PHC34_02620 [Candidatus Gastranaerophilales bacterium]|nr:hypothetical protein [Candidatus Gastranaerophilales bacterium]